MLDAAGLEKWIAENGTGNKERKYINGIDYLFVTMNDGWIAIFEYSERDMKQRRGSPASFFFLAWLANTNFIL